MVQYFLDGTPCEGGGKCSNGNCEGVSLGRQITDWINNNKEIFIPVVSVVGSIILICIICCFWSCFRGRRRSRRVVPKPASPYGWSAQYFGAPPPAAAAVPGSSGAAPPMRPGQAYAPLPPQDARFEPMRTRSFRYA
jgi:hypothetical protein